MMGTSFYMQDSYNFDDYDINSYGKCCMCEKQLNYNRDTIMVFEFGSYCISCFKSWRKQIEAHARSN